MDINGFLNKHGGLPTLYLDYNFLLMLIELNFSGTKWPSKKIIKSFTFKWEKSRS